MSGASRFSGGWCRVGPGLIARNIGLPLQVATLALVIRALRHGSRRTIGVAATAVAALALLHLMRFTGARPDLLGVVLTLAGLLALALLRRGGRGRRAGRGRPAGPGAAACPG
jgi:hypothetical protein